MTRSRIGVFGAGAIGAYVGIRLSAAGYPVTLLGRASLVSTAGKLSAIDLAGSTARPGDDLKVTTDVADLADCSICLVTVKSGDSENAGAALAPVLGKDAAVISLQNGLGNVERLQKGGLTQSGFPGLVTFNVHRPDPTTFVQATNGPISIAKAPATEPMGQALADAGVVAELREDLIAVQTTKLLLNLNNGLCALTGVAIRDSIRSKDLRWCFSTCIREGMRVMSAANMPIVRIGRLSPTILARMLLLPNFIVKRLAGSFMKIDPGARSSTLQDLDVGKKTEIDFLNGEIVRLAEQAGTQAPASQFVVDQVHELEASGVLPPPFLDPAEVRRGLQRVLS